MTIPYCDEIRPEYCEKNIHRIDAACHDLGFPPGKHILLNVDDKFCYCLCGGVPEEGFSEPSGPAVQLADGTEIPASALRPGESRVAAAGLDLQFAPTLVERSLPMAATEAQPVVYLGYQAGGRARSRVLRFEQPVLVRRENALRLLAAGYLCPEDRCLDSDGQPVVLEAIEAGFFQGTLWEFATRMDPPDAQLTGHLLVTEGIVTGDLAVVTYAGSLPAAGSAEGTERPYVGSRAWREQWSAFSAPASVTLSGGIFRSAAALQVAVPPFSSP